MDRPGPAISSPTDTSESFEDRIGILFEELAFALRWRRPSILLVFYESDDQRAAAELALEKRLIASRRPAIAIGVTERAFDLPLALSRRPDRRKAVYFVSGFAGGGGRDGANAYRALNMRRELLVDHRVRAVFWLRQSEAVELSRHAPDFWAFRHRVVELDSAPEADTLEALLGDRSERDWSRPGGEDHLDPRIVLRERLLGDPGRDGLSAATRVRLLSSLAGLYRARGDLSQALKLLKQSLELARRLDGPGLLAWHWGQLGLIHSALGQTSAALQACGKAIDLQSQEAGSWDCLGEVRLAAGQPEAALDAFRSAVQLGPGEARGWYGLGRAHQRTGRAQEALAAFRKAVRLDARHAGAWDRLGALNLELDRPEQALRACKKAVRLVPRNAACWEGLGQVRFRLGHLPDAIIAYQQAVANDPGNPAVHGTLALLYRRAGQEGPAAEEIEIGRSMLKDEPEYRQALFEAARGRLGQALELLGKALQAGQAGWGPPAFEPAFESLRDDPRFAAVVRQA